jgi:hypothetical protein
MEEEIKAQPKPKGSGSKKNLTPEEAEAKLLATLETAGAKGKQAPYTKRKGMPIAVYEETLERLESEGRREIYVDRRGAKPKYFLWAYRPKAPTLEEVAGKIAAAASCRHPRVFALNGLLKEAVLDKDEKALGPEAVEQLRGRGILAALEFAPTGKTTHTLYVAVEKLDGAHVAPVFSPGEVLAAYDGLVRQEGFRAVPISKLQAISKVPMERLKEWLREEHEAGRVVLSVGDWSIAPEEEKAGVIEWQGRRYLQVRWL